MEVCLHSRQYMWSEDPVLVWGNIMCKIVDFQADKVRIKGAETAKHFAPSNIVPVPV